MAAQLPTTFGKYSLLHMLGRGGSGAAYLAVPLREDASPSPVVIKLLHPDAAQDPSDRARFEHEAKLALSTNLKSIARVYEVGVAGETPYIAMELVRGMSLSRLMSALRDRGAVLPVPEVLGLAASAIAGVRELHEATDEDGRALGAIHRDLSPNNLMVDPSGRVRILDLGMGRSRLRDHRTQTGLIIGTPGYMSPEQSLSGRISQRSDVYTMGVIFWELLTGRRYITPGELASVLAETVKRVFEPPSAFRPRLSPDVDEVCRRALERDPERRFASAAEMYAELEALKALRFDRVGGQVVPLHEVYAYDLAPEELGQLLALDPREDADETEIKEADTDVLESDTLVREPETEVRERDTSISAREPAKVATVLSRMQRSWAPLLGVLFALGGVTVFAVLWLPAPSEEVVEVRFEPPAVETAIPAPGIQPREAVEEVVEEAPAPEKVEEKRTTPVRKDSATKQVAAVAEPTAEELVTRLNQQARIIKRAQPDRAAEVDDLLNAVLFESTAGDTPAVRARLKEIAAALERIKASAKTP